MQGIGSSSIKQSLENRVNPFANKDIANKNILNLIGKHLVDRSKSDKLSDFKNFSRVNKCMRDSLNENTDGHLKICCNEISAKIKEAKDLETEVKQLSFYEKLVCCLKNMITSSVNEDFYLDSFVTLMSSKQHIFTDTFGEVTMPPSFLESYLFKLSISSPQTAMKLLQRIHIDTNQNLADNIYKIRNAFIFMQGFLADKGLIEKEDLKGFLDFIPTPRLSLFRSLTNHPIEEEDSLMNQKQEFLNKFSEVRELGTNEIKEQLFGDGELEDQLFKRDPLYYALTYSKECNSELLKEVSEKRKKLFEGYYQSLFNNNSQRQFDQMTRHLELMYCIQKTKEISTNEEKNNDKTASQLKKLHQKFKNEEITLNEFNERVEDLLGKFEIGLNTIIDFIEKMDSICSHQQQKVKSWDDYEDWDPLKSY